MFGDAWKWIVSRVTPEQQPVNSAADQDLLNRINLGQYRPVAVSGTGASSATTGQTVAGQTVSGESAQLAGQPAASQTPSSASAVGSDASATNSVPDAAHLRAQRLAHLEGRASAEQS